MLVADYTRLCTFTQGSSYTEEIPGGAAILGGHPKPRGQAAIGREFT